MKTALKKLTAAVLCILLAVGICASSLGELIIDEKNYNDPSLVKTIDRLISKSNEIQVDLGRMCLYNAARYNALIGVHLTVIKEIMKLPLLGDDISRLVPMQRALENAKDVFEDFIEMGDEDQEVAEYLERIKNTEYYNALKRDTNANSFNLSDIGDIKKPF